MTDIKPLKLQANNTQEVDIIATFLQDALVPVQGLHFNSETHQFLMFSHRFKWELTTQPNERHERVHTGVSFSHVTHVAYKGFDLKEHRHHSLNLLTIRANPQAGEIRLIFSDDAEVILTIKKIMIHLQDMSEPWPAQGGKPHHDIEEA